MKWMKKRCSGVIMLLLNKNKINMLPQETNKIYYYKLLLIP